MRHHDDSHDDKLNHMKLWDIVVIAGSLGLSLFVCICVGVAWAASSMSMPGRRRGD